MEHRRLQERRRYRRQYNRYVPHARQLLNQIRDAERRRRESMFINNTDSNRNDTETEQSNSSETEINNREIGSPPPLIPLPVTMSSPTHSVRVNVFHQSTEHGLLQFFRSLPFSEEQALEILSRDIIGLHQKIRILSSSPTFLSILSKNSKVFYPTAAAVANKDICSICLSELDQMSCLRELKCEHSFHLACIDRWLLRYLTCPLCRRGILGNNFEINDTLLDDDDFMLVFARLNDSDSEESESIPSFLQRMLVTPPPMDSPPHPYDEPPRHSSRSYSDDSDSEQPTTKRQRVGGEFGEGAGASNFEFEDNDVTPGLLPSERSDSTSEVAYVHGTPSTCSISNFEMDNTSMMAHASASREQTPDLEGGNNMPVIELSDSSSQEGIIEDGDIANPQECMQTNRGWYYPYPTDQEIDDSCNQDEDRFRHYNYVPRRSESRNRYSPYSQVDYYQPGFDSGPVEQTIFPSSSMMCDYPIDRLAPECPQPTEIIDLSNSDEEEYSNIGKSIGPKHREENNNLSEMMRDDGDDTLVNVDNDVVVISDGED